MKCWFENLLACQRCWISRYQEWSGHHAELLREAQLLLDRCCCSESASIANANASRELKFGVRHGLAFDCTMKARVRSSVASI